MRQEPGGVRFVDSNALLTTTTCTLVNSHDVFCAGLAETLSVELGDGDDVVDVQGTDAVLVVGTARGVAASIADAGGVDAISVACAGARVTATGGTRDRRGRYVLPGGTVTFAGLDGALPCVLPRLGGLTVGAAQRAVARAGLRVVKVTSRRSAKVRRGRVISARRTGATVALVVSSGQA